MLRNYKNQPADPKRLGTAALCKGRQYSPLPEAEGMQIDIPFAVCYALKYNFFKDIATTRHTTRKRTTVTGAEAGE